MKVKRLKYMNIYFNLFCIQSCLADEEPWEQSLELEEDDEIENEEKIEGEVNEQKMTIKAFSDAFSSEVNEISDGSIIPSTICDRDSISFLSSYIKHSESFMEGMFSLDAKTVKDLNIVSGGVGCEDKNLISILSKDMTHIGRVMLFYRIVNPISNREAFKTRA